nr:MAG TPA: Replication initiator A family protein [Caudoviricetes sp.]
MKDGTFINIQSWMINDYSLTGNKLTVYAFIYGFSQDDQGCFYGSSSYIIESLKLGRSTVLEILKELEADGLLRKWQEKIDGRVTNCYSAQRPDPTANHNPSENDTSTESEPVRKPDVYPSESRTFTSTETGHKKEKNNKANNKAPSATRFSPPTVEQVRAYFRERGVPPADAQTEADKFVDRYEANGWIVGKTKMKDWKAAARNWLRNRKEWGQPAAQPATPYGGRTWEDL